MQISPVLFFQRLRQEQTLQVFNPLTGHFYELNDKLALAFTHYFTGCDNASGLAQKLLIPLSEAQQLTQLLLEQGFLLSEEF